MKMYYGIFIVSILITLISQIYISVTYSKLKKIKSKKKISGVETSHKILKNNDLENIYVVEVPGNLTDHYDPAQKVIRLSHEIFNDDNLASIAVAAHETGHAIQDKDGNFFIRMRKFMVPFVSIASRFGYVALVIGFISGILDFIYVGIGLLTVILFFQLITLPVEFGASKIAKEQLKKLSLVDNNEMIAINSMLTAAAFTYVASLITTLLEILRLILSIKRRD